MSYLLLIIAIATAQDGIVSDSLIFRTEAWVIGIVVFLIMILCVFFGVRLGRRLRRSGNNAEYKFPDITVSSMFGLMAFLLAFSFGMSTSRFDQRRKNIVDETNAIGSALLRTDLYLEEDRNGFRKEFKDYLDARIGYYEAKTDIDRILAAKRAAENIQVKLWKRVADGSRREEYRTASLAMIPAMTQMFDLRTTRLIGELDRVPGSIVMMLFVLAWSSAFYLGYNSGRKGQLDWLPCAGFCLLTSIVIYITLDLDRSRRGIIQLSTAHKAMYELQQHFKSDQGATN